MQNEPPKRHHFVPRGYLKSFCSKSDSGSKKMIYVYQKSRNVDPSLKSTKSICWRQEYYPDSYEKFLSEYENKACIIIRRIIESNSVHNIPVDEKETLSSFIALLITRNPKIITELERTHTKMMKNSFKTLQREGRLPAPPPVIADHISDFDKFFKVDVNRDLLTWGFLGVTKHIAAIITSKKWILYTAGQDSVFITSDVPVVEISNGQFQGPAHPEIVLLLPLSPKHLLLITGANFTHQVISATPEMTKGFNEKIAQGATGELYASIDSEDIINLAKL